MWKWGGVFLGHEPFRILLFLPSLFPCLSYYSARGDLQAKLPAAVRIKAACENILNAD